MHIKTYVCVLLFVIFIIINVHLYCGMYFITFQIMGIQYDDYMILTYCYYQYYISIDNIISMVTKKISLGRYNILL